MGRGSGTQAPATASSGGRRMASAAAMERRQAAADCRRSWRWRRRWRHRHGERPGGPRPALCGKRPLGLGSSGFGGGTRLECAERAAPSQSGGRVPLGYFAVVGDRPPGAHPPPSPGGNARRIASIDYSDGFPSRDLIAITIAMRSEAWICFVAS